MNAHLRRCSLALTLLLAPCAHAGTLFVNVQQTSGADDGSSWADALQGTYRLQDAPAASLPGDQIRVAQGVYLPSATGDRLEWFRFRTGVEVYGGLQGGETGLDQREVETFVTVLSGDLLGDDSSGGSNAENSFHVLHGNAADETAVFDGFTVSAGNATTPHPTATAARASSARARRTGRRCASAASHRTWPPSAAARAA